jgi:hypothetical protein
MDLEKSARRSVVLFIVFGFSILIFGTNCTLGRMISDQYNIDRTNTSFALDTIWAQTYTEEARAYNGQTATSIQATDNSMRETNQAEYKTFDAKMAGLTQTELAPKPPRITKIDFPGEIPGNRSTIIGLLYFKDDDGDISHVVYRVITATEFSGGTDTKPQLNSGTWTDGSLKIYVFCEGEQYVTLEATIVDYAGNKSNPLTFSFTCKVSN